MSLAPRAYVAVSGALLIVWFLASFRHSVAGIGSSLLHTKRNEVQAAFQHAWKGYSTHCMGHDSLRPVSNECRDEFGGWGATAIDALSTAIMFRNEEVVLEILPFIAELDLRTTKDDQNISLFEVLIRHLAGMISAYDLLTGPYSDLVKNETLVQALYGKMVELGDVLSCGFATPSGVPNNWVSASRCETEHKSRAALVGVGTTILEFARLSHLTNDTKYIDLASRAQSYVIDPHPANLEVYPGLLGSWVSVSDGRLLDQSGSWGAFSDSYYEYLLKAYLYDPDIYAPYLERWKLAADSTIQHIASHPFGRPDLTFLPSWNGEHRVNAMESLSWFAGGNFILGGMVLNNDTLLNFGLELADTAGHIYSTTATGLGGEFVTWTTDCDEKWGHGPCSGNNSVRTSTAEYKMRPEVLETWYYAFRATGDVKYQNWAWQTFLALNSTCRTQSGFSAISDVDALDGGEKLDQQESFLFAEVLKYLWLILDDVESPIHVEDSRLDRKNFWVFNTEAHPLRVGGRPV